MGHWIPTPYEQRTDLERIQSQWRKINGLLGRKDWSAAVVRAATAAEIAVNLVIREELFRRSEFDADFVNSLLKWGNGLTGKVRHLMLPLLRGKTTYEQVKALCRLANGINEKRNAIAHRGEFCDEDEATGLIAKCHDFVIGLVKIYSPEFRLNSAESAGKEQVSTGDVQS